MPRTIPSLPDLEGIRVLRTYDESLALRAHAGSAKRAVVIGAGFIGCEVAASLRKMGVDVTIVEPQPTPLASVLGTEIGELVARLHRAEGVDVRCGVGVTGVTGTGHVEKVQRPTAPNWTPTSSSSASGRAPPPTGSTAAASPSTTASCATRRPHQCAERVGHR